MAVFKIGRGQIYGRKRGRDMSKVEWVLWTGGMLYFLGHLAASLWG